MSESDALLEAANRARCEQTCRYSQEKADTIAALHAEIEKLKAGYTATQHDIQQKLGKALGYPWFKDDPTSFPNATEADGVCVGDHVAESLADEAAAKITALRARVEKLEKALKEIMELPGEINPSNYDHNDVVILNDSFCEAFHIASAALEGRT